MAWAVLTDDLYDNQKVVSFSHPAFRLWICSIVYARRHRTQGKLSDQQARLIMRLTDVPLRTGQELVEKRGWDKLDGGGYLIHDYEQFYAGDPTAAERMQRYRNRGVTKGVTESVTGPSPDRNTPRNVLGGEGIPAPSPPHPLPIRNTPPTPPPSPAVTGNSDISGDPGGG